jgi:DNA-binding NarL/FixJ family response regulator
VVRLQQRPEVPATVITLFLALNVRLLGDALARSLEEVDGLEVLAHGPLGGAEAVQELLRLRPDVALLDAALPGLDGPAATEQILASSPGAKVLLLSGVFGPEHVERALAAGAAGFLPKSLGFAQLVEAIRLAHSGAALVYGDDLADLVDVLKARIREGDDLYARYETLTHRELEILRHLGAGRTTSEVAVTMAMSVGTVKNHLTRVFTKTGADTRLEAVETARRIGLIPSRA